MKIRMNLTIGFPGASREEVVEVDDDSTRADLDEITEDWASGYVEWWHEPEEDE